MDITNASASTDWPDVDFPGRERFIPVLDHAVAQKDEHAVTAALRNALCHAIRDRAIELPACVHEPVTTRYARRELYRSPEFGYSVVAMTWAPGQGTLVHDHDGLWCVEGVWAGELEITQYELLERAGDRVRFRAAGGMQAGAGSAGSLIPPHEYHTIRNASDDTVAVSLHIYKAPMQACAMFEVESGEWYTRIDRTLCSDRTG